MNHHRQLYGTRQRELFAKDTCLVTTRRKVIMIVEADLAPSDNTRMLRQPFENL